MTTSDVRLNFPLYHGSSTLYLEQFQLGRAPSNWPHKEAALNLLRQLWNILSLHGRIPDSWVQQVLAQASEHSNWRHGLLHVTPSRISAVRYADGGSSFGGELLTLCQQALIALGDIDPMKASELAVSAPSLSELLKGGGEPLLVEVRDFTIDDLLPERAGDDLADVEDLIAWSDELRELMGQQKNFSVKPGRGRVASLSRITVKRLGTRLRLTN
jgi:hypothetical protein